MKLKTATEVTQYSSIDPNPYIGIVYCRIVGSGYIVTNESYDKIGINYELLKEVEREVYNSQTNQMETVIDLIPFYTNTKILTKQEYTDFKSNHLSPVFTHELDEENYLHLCIIKQMMSEMYSLSINDIIELDIN